MKVLKPTVPGERKFEVGVAPENIIVTIDDEWNFEADKKSTQLARAFFLAKIIHTRVLQRRKQNKE